jgi:hypothetical protein
MNMVGGARRDQGKDKLVQVHNFCRDMRLAKETGNKKSIQLVSTFFMDFLRTMDQSKTPKEVFRISDEVVKYIRGSYGDFSNFNTLAYRHVMMYLVNLERYLRYMFASMEEFTDTPRGLMPHSQKILHDFDMPTERTFGELFTKASEIDGDSDMAIDILEQYEDDEYIMRNYSNFQRDDSWNAANTPIAESGYQYAAARGIVNPVIDGRIEDFKRTKAKREIENNDDPGVTSEERYKDLRYARLGIGMQERNMPSLANYSQRNSRYQHY